MIELPAALALLSISAPITVAVIKYVQPRKTRGDAVTHREFDAFRSECRIALSEIRKDVRDIRRSLLGP